MNNNRIICIISLLMTLSIYPQESTTSNSADKEIETQKILEIEANLKRQEQEIKELKKMYGVKTENKNSNQSKEVGEDNYVSPLKQNGLTPDYNRAMFLDPSHAKKFNKNQKPWLNDWIRVGANIRPRYEDRYNLGFDKQNKGYISRIIQMSQIFFLIDPSPYFTMKVTFQDSRVWGGSTPVNIGDRAPYFAGVGNTVTPVTSSTIPAQTYLREGWFMIKKLPLDAKLQIGRQVIAYGDQRMIGGANWNGNGLSFDGTRLMFDQNNFSIHFLGYKVIGNQPAPNGVLSANSPTNYTDPASGKTSVVNPGLPNQFLVGTYNTAKYKDWFLVDLYSLGILTQKTPFYRGATLTNPTLEIPATSDSDLYNNQWSKQKNNLWTTGFRITNRTSANNLAANSPWSGWDWTIEAAWQSGSTGNRVNKNPSLNSALNMAISEATGNPLNSYNFLTQNQKYTGKFFVLQTGYTFSDRLRIGGQILYASGDSNRTDGSNSTFQTLPAPRFAVIPYWNNFAGLAENISAKNLISKTVNISYKTDEYGTFYLSYFVNDKANTQDSWYAISGAANAGSSTEFNGQGQTTIALARSGRRIYSELDFTWMYNINDYVSLWIGGGILTAGNSIKNQKNSAFHYNLQTGNISTNYAVLLGQSGASPNAYMFFTQFNAAF